MSPKNCSLALDEIEDCQNFEDDLCFEPKLTVLVNRQKSTNSTADNVIKVTGRVEVSF